MVFLNLLVYHKYELWTAMLKQDIQNLPEIPKAYPYLYFGGEMNMLLQNSNIKSLFRV